jgi:hypothetical protein
MPLPQPVAHDRLARAVIDALAHYELELARGNATGGMTEMARLLRRGWGPPS